MLLFSFGLPSGAGVRQPDLHSTNVRKIPDTTLDNLREGVTAPGIYDPTINLLFRDALAHYGVVTLPCRTVLGEIFYLWLAPLRVEMANRTVVKRRGLPK